MDNEKAFESLEALIKENISILNEYNSDVYNDE